MLKIQLRNKTFDQITYYKTGAGPALLLVHGFPANVQLWRFLIPELSLSLMDDVLIVVGLLLFGSSLFCLCCYKVLSRKIF